MAANILLALQLLLAVATAEAKIRGHLWDIAYELKSPDCFQKRMITINGRSPGPTIFAEQGDQIFVRINNHLGNQNTTVHWHGIRQIGTPWSDGTDGVTQCPILPGESFTYDFVVDRPGTYIYHAHSGLQRSDGLYGSIIVSPPSSISEPFSYDFDESIILSDWWHESAREQAAGLDSVPFVWVGEPQSLLINGTGSFNCSSAGPSDVCNADNSECSPFALTVKPGKTYRLRIGSITSLSALNFEIQDHKLTVVEVDGHYVEPFAVKNLNIYAGETYSVLVTADRDPSRNYWIAINVVSRIPNTTTGLGIFNYSPTKPIKTPPTTPPVGPLWSDTSYRLNQSRSIRAHRDHIHKPPSTSDHQIIFLNTQNKINSRIRWSLNNVSFTLPLTPYLIAFKEGLPHTSNQTKPPEAYDHKNYNIWAPPPNPSATYSDAVYRLDFNSTIDVVLQNANVLDPNRSETHPWHLHGHDFWVLGYGEGKFDQVNDPKGFNLKDPIMMNTVPVHPYGWTAIRFRVDNPGVWAFHCHIASHFHLGMGVVFEEGVEKVRELPPTIMGCVHSSGGVTYRLGWVGAQSSFYKYIILLISCVLIL